MSEKYLEVGNVERVLHVTILTNRAIVYALPFAMIRRRDESLESFTYVKDVNNRMWIACFSFPFVD